MSVSILAEAEIFTPESGDGWHHCPKVATYLYPEMPASEFEDYVANYPHAFHDHDTADETAYRIGGDRVAQFIADVNEADGERVIPDIPAELEGGDLVITFLY